MFTIEEIQKAHTKVNSGVDFPNFIQEIKSMGVVRYDIFVINGLAVYYGNNNYNVQGSAAYDDLLIAEKSSIDGLKEALKVHQKGATDYQTFCEQVASAGVEEWVTDLNKMTVAYLDVAGNEMLVEYIPQT